MPHDDLTPEEEQVRRLLADARHTEPLPDDVAARLDQVLAGLADEPVARPTPSVTDLDAARRRRTVRTWLVAAAAVVVAGVGLNQVDWNGMTASDDSSSSASDAGGDAEREVADEDAAPAPEAASTDQSVPEWQAARLHLSAERFGDQVERFRTGTNETSARGGLTLSESQADDDAAFDALVCDFATPGHGYAVPVRYDGARAWLVFRKPAGDSQVVDLYLCGSDEPTRSITLPAL